MKRLCILLIRWYQMFISPLFPRTCRFYPTCSAYFIQALEKYGFLADSDAVDFVDRMMGQGVGGSSYETELDNITISFEKEYEEEIKEVIADVGKQEIVDRVIKKIKES